MWYLFSFLFPLFSQWQSLWSRVIHVLSISSILPPQTLLKYLNYLFSTFEIPLLSIESITQSQSLQVDFFTLYFFSLFLITLCLQTEQLFVDLQIPLEILILLLSPFSNVLDSVVDIWIVVGNYLWWHIWSLSYAPLRDQKSIVMIFGWMVQVLVLKKLLRLCFSLFSGGDLGWY